MSERDLNESRKSSGKGRDENETHRGWKSKWVESTSPAADDPVDEEEMKGHNILGVSSLRDGAIAGVSEPARDGHGAPGERPDDVRYDGPRMNPPELEDVPGDGGEETTQD